MPHGAHRRPRNDVPLAVSARPAVPAAIVPLRMALGARESLGLPQERLVLIDERLRRLPALLTAVVPELSPVLFQLASHLSEQELVDRLTQEQVASLSPHRVPPVLGEHPVLLGQIARPDEVVRPLHVASDERDQLVDRPIHVGQVVVGACWSPGTTVAHHLCQSEDADELQPRHLQQVVQRLVIICAPIDEELPKRQPRIALADSEDVADGVAARLHAITAVGL